MLKAVTENPARVLKLVNKGKLQQGFDADLLLLDADTLSLHSVMAKGTWFMQAGSIVRKGLFESDLLRSLFFIAASLGLLWLAFTQKMKATPVMILFLVIAIGARTARKRLEKPRSLKCPGADFVRFCGALEVEEVVFLLAL